MTASDPNADHRDNDQFSLRFNLTKVQFFQNTKTLHRRINSKLKTKPTNDRAGNRYAHGCKSNRKRIHSGRETFEENKRNDYRMQN